MSGTLFRVIPLNKAHDRSTFNSGSEPLDCYFRERVTQDIRRRVTACFVAISCDGRIAGYYTLASASVFLGDLPEKLTKKLPRYPSVPVVRMGRLAVGVFAMENDLLRRRASRAHGLRESKAPYKGILGHENGPLSRNRHILGRIVFEYL